MNPADQYGSIQGKYGELHDWYLIGLALVVLGVIMRYFPEWGIKLGWVVLLLAILYAYAETNTFERLVSIIQTGTLQGKTTPIQKG